MDNSADSKRDLYESVRPFLKDGEELLWIGRPYTSQKYRVHVGQGIFMLLWLGFAVFWTVSATRSSGFFGLFGIPFVILGVYSNLSVHIFRRRRLSRIVYAVTDSRAIIVEHGAKRTRCHEYFLSNLPDVHLESVNGYTGTICFRKHKVYRYYDLPSPDPDRNRINDRTDSESFFSDSFLMIDDVHRVYMLVTKTA